MWKSLIFISTQMIDAKITKYNWNPSQFVCPDQLSRVLHSESPATSLYFISHFFVPVYKPRQETPDSAFSMVQHSLRTDLVSTWLWRNAQRLMWIKKTIPSLSNTSWLVSLGLLFPSEVKNVLCLDQEVILQCDGMIFKRLDSEDKECCSNYNFISTKDALLECLQFYITYFKCRFHTIAIRWIDLSRWREQKIADIDRQYT
jgi:hypothetical protein